MARRAKGSGLIRDLGLVALSVVVAINLVRTDAIVSILTQTQELEFIGSFVAGLFFTSIFTTAPAIVTLGEIAQEYSLFLTAIAGGLGAVVGDLIIFHIVKHRFADHVTDLIQTQGGGRRLVKVLKRRSSKWITFLVGGLIIASPLPDELGVALLGIARLKAEGVIIISFVFNTLGIILIGLAARAVQ